MSLQLSTRPMRQKSAAEAYRTIAALSPDDSFDLSLDAEKQRILDDREEHAQLLVEHLDEDGCEAIMRLSHNGPMTAQGMALQFQILDDSVDAAAEALAQKNLEPPKRRAVTPPPSQRMRFALSWAVGMLSSRNNPADHDCLQYARQVMADDKRRTA